MIERIAIIGAGRVGRSLGQALVFAGYAVDMFIDHDLSAAERASFACDAVGDGRAASRAEKIRAPMLREAWKHGAAADEESLAGGDWDLILIAVPDDAIAAVVQRLTAQAPHLSGCVVAHCSGSLAAAVLQPLEMHTPLLASMHPLQSFSGHDDDYSRWANIFIALEGEEESLQRLEVMVSRLGSQSFRISADQKPAYHTACVFLSNFLVALYDAAEQLLDAVPLPEAKKRIMTAPLVTSTLANVLAYGAGPALTGPIARGDAETIGRHLHMLNARHPELTGLYGALGRYTLEMARRDHHLPDIPANQIAELLTTTVY